MNGSYILVQSGLSINTVVRIFEVYIPGTLVCIHLKKKNESVKGKTKRRNVEGFVFFVRKREREIHDKQAQRKAGWLWL